MQAMTSKPAVAFDTETSYSKDRDIRSLGTVPYLRHPETDIYLVSFCFPDGTTWAGDPKDAPWDKALQFDFVSHNRSFDLAVYQELRRRGMPLPEPPTWHCSADLMAYLQAPRSLAAASAIMLGTQVSKTTRDEMKGVDYRKLPPEKKRQVDEYARSDALLCWLLWRNHSAEWPEHERWLSRHTTDMGLRGIGLDEAEVERGIDILKQVSWEAERAIPWAGDRPTTSTKQLALACRAANIPPPTTTDSKSDIFDEWADQYAEQAPFVAAMQRWRRSNRLVQVLRAMQTRCVDGRVRFNLKYFGAQHTGRWSGDAGLNMQNFPRKAFEEIDVRRNFVPRPGHCFLVTDLSQIEARVALWLAGDRRMLDRLAAGEDVYEAHARLTMGYTDPRPLAEVDPGMRQLAKIRSLALQFSLGFSKFQKIAKQWAGIDMTEDDAKRVVRDYRQKNKPIVDLWGSLERAILTYDKDEQGRRWGYAQLPSGRVIRYMDLQEVREPSDYGDGYRSRWSGRVVRGECRKFLYGGLLTENVTQATARDILAAKIRETEMAGMPVVLHVHDEIVAEVPEANAEEAARQLDRIMSTPPEWAEGLPMRADTKILKRYGK